MRGFLKIGIGVRGFERPDQVTLPKILTQPFRDEPKVRAFLEDETGTTAAIA